MQVVEFHDVFLLQRRRDEQPLIAVELAAIGPKSLRLFGGIDPALEVGRPVRLGVGEDVRADGRKWPGRDRVGAQFALGQPVLVRGSLARLAVPAHLGHLPVCVLHTRAPGKVRCCLGCGGMVLVVEFHQVLQL